MRPTGINNCMAASLTLLCSLLLPAVTLASGNISPTDKYAWSETGGWSNFAPTGGGVSVYDDHLEGYAWNENIGWIKLGSYSGGGYHTYANSSAADWGVNLSGANLSGFAWSETSGWINFAPTGGGVTLNPASGVFDGYAWAENLGWIHFKAVNPAYNVVFVPDNKTVSAVTVAAVDPLKVQAAVSGSGVHLSSDGGASWSEATIQVNDRRLKAMLTHPASATTLFAATYGSGLFKSVDSGVTWNACANTGLNLNVYSLTMANNGILYAGTRGGVFTSSDCGVWSPRNSNLPSSGGLYSQSVLAADPASVTTLYAGIDGNGIYKTTDSGASWTAATTQPASTAIRSLLIKPGDPAKLFAASYGSGLFRSSNSGVDWSVCANSGLTDLYVLSLKMDGTGRLYAGTEAGVFVSSDGCASWSAFNTGLPFN